MKWEYKTIKMYPPNFKGAGFELNSVDEFINQFGELGWELVSTQKVVQFDFGQTSEIILFFKRPLAE